MKKIARFLVLMFTLVVLTGCVKAEYHVILNKDGSANFDTTIGISNEMYGMVASQGNPFEELTTELETDGFEVSEYKGDDHTGIKASKTFETIADIKINDAETGEKQTPFTVEKEEGLFTTSYKVKGSLDLSSKDVVTEDGAGGSEESLGEFGNAVLSDVTFKLTTPSELKSSNATSTDEATNTSTWELKPGEKNEISFETTTPNSTGLILVLVVGVLLVVLVALVVVLKRKRV